MGDIVSPLDRLEQFIAWLSQVVAGDKNAELPQLELWRQAFIEYFHWSVEKVDRCLGM